MKTLALLWLTLLAGTTAAQAKPIGKLISSTPCGDYTILIYRGTEETGQGSFEISKGSKVIFEGNGFSFEIWHGTTSSGKEVPLVGEDLTLSGYPQVVIREWTGGAHCCFTAKVFRLRDTPELIATIEAKDSEDEPLFTQTALDKPWQVCIHDWTFAYWPYSFATSPAPKVILKWNGTKYVVDKERMRKPAPAASELSALADKIRNGKWGSPGKYFEAPRELYSTALDLMYSGHEDLGWNFLHEAWNPAYPGYEKFAESFRRRLEESPYWAQLK